MLNFLRVQPMLKLQFLMMSILTVVVVNTVLNSACCSGHNTVIDNTIKRYYIYRSLDHWQSPHTDINMQSITYHFVGTVMSSSNCQLCYVALAYK